MIRATEQKAVLAGVGVLFLAQVLYVLVLVKVSYHEILRSMLLGAPAMAACMAAYLSPSRKMLIGLSMALCGAVIGLLSAMGYEYFGLHVDRIGGPLATFAILLAYYVALSVAGSVVGIALSRKGE